MHQMAVRPGNELLFPQLEATLRQGSHVSLIV